VYILGVAMLIIKMDRTEAQLREYARLDAKVDSNLAELRIAEAIHRKLKQEYQTTLFSVRHIQGDDSTLNYLGINEQQAHMKVQEEERKRNININHFTNFKISLTLLDVAHMLHRMQEMHQQKTHLYYMLNLRFENMIMFVKDIAKAKYTMKDSASTNYIMNRSIELDKAIAQLREYLHVFPNNDDLKGTLSNLLRKRDSDPHYSERQRRVAFAMVTDPRLTTDQRLLSPELMALIHTQL